MIVKRDPHCSKCGLCESAATVCLLGTGPKKSRVMVIGEAPGQTEDAAGKPFIGSSGRILRAALSECGIDPDDDVYVTNAVHCRPPKNRTPKKKEIAACKEWLLAEIRMVRPQFILLLGNVPLESLTGQKGIRKLRGQPIEVAGSSLGLDEHKTVYLFPAYHPSYTLHDQRQAPVFARDVYQFSEIVKRGGPLAEKGLNYTIVTKHNFKEAIRDIRNSTVISWDCETSGLYPWAPGAYITSMGVGTGEHQWCFPLNHTQGPLYGKFKAQKRWVRKIAEAMEGKVIVAHNGKFDSVFTRVIFGIWIQVTFDTMLAHYNLNENALHGLDHLAGEYFDAMDYDIPLKEKHGYGPLDRHCRYLALDIYYTRRLYFKLKRKLKLDPPTWRLFSEFTMPVARMYSDIEYEGVYVDQQELEQGRKYWQGIADTALARLNKLVPDTRTRKDKKTKQVITGINWGSPDQVAEVLFDRLKLKAISYTPGGKRQVNELVLKQLDHEVPKLILQWREATKNLGTFINAWAEWCVDSRMHPSFKVHGTVTGRPSCEDPNLQQVPRDKRLRRMIRSRPGWTLIDADESQAELRIAAELSGDPALRLAYQTGQDVHRNTVQWIFGIKNPTSEERKKGKAINFGFLYGMGWRKFIEQALEKYNLVFTESEAKRIRKMFFRLYHGLPKWHERQRKFARNNGYVMNLVGRKRRLPDAQLQGDSDFINMRRAEAQRQAINSPVQSLSTDWNLMAALQLHGSLDPSYFRIVGTVHDSILMEVRDDMLEEVLPQIQAAMERPKMLDKWRVRFDIPMVSELELGPWGDPTAAFVEKKIVALAA